MRTDAILVSLLSMETQALRLRHHFNFAFFMKTLPSKLDYQWMKKIMLILGVFFLFAGSAFAQNSLRELESEAQAFFERQKYPKALYYLLEYQKQKKADDEMLLKTAICFYHNNDTDNAKKYLIYLNENSKRVDPKTYLYLAKSYHAELDFKNAAKQYKRYLAKTKDTKDRRSIRDAIRRCAAGMKIKAQEKLALVENLGDKVNSTYDDFAPVLSPNREDKLYFSSSREGNLGGLRDGNGLRDSKFGAYSSDMYSTNVINGEWTATTSMSTLLNTPRHDVVLDFSDNGSILYFFKGYNQYSGQIFVDTFKSIQDRALFPNPFLSPMVAENGDGNPDFVKDSIIIFSSYRKEGYGGSDLYYTIKGKNGWGRSMNLGAAINTPYDETTPFLAADGFTLYFSSNHSRKSMGGLDIFKSTYDPIEKMWSTPVNLGLPINSAGDDAYFKLAKDGLKAYFSSDRRDGIGGRDLYAAYFKSYSNEQTPPYRPPYVFTEVEAQRQEEEALAKATDIEMSLGDVAMNPSLEVKNKANYKTIELAPLYYKNDDDVLNQNNINVLNELINVMTQYPTLKLILTCHSDDTAPTQFNIYFAIKRAEQAAAYLVQNGVSRANIILKGVGANYPVARTEVNGQSNLLGKHFNSRIDVDIIDNQQLPINVIIASPEVSSMMLDRKGTDYKNKIEGLSYKIEIASIKQMYNGDLMNTYLDAMVEKMLASPYYYYTVGLYKNYNDVDQQRKDLNRKGYTNVQIIPYINGQRMTFNQAKAYTALYPDLRTYVRRSSNGL